MTHPSPQDRPASTDPYILLTGATGLVGQYLLRDLLASGRRVAVLARPNRRFSASQRIEHILARWERERGELLPRPVVLEGDLEQPVLGLSEEQQQWLQAHCDSIVHNAAILKFEATSANDEPWRTNLDGSRRVLELCRETGIRKMHYVSTSYVSGLVSRFREDQLDVGQTFRNDYERSKFQAEKLIRNFEHFDSVTVYRPAVIVGDSKTGFTCTYHGLFVYLRLLALLLPHQQRDANGIIQTRVTVPVQGDEPRNMVPVDWVSGVICHIVNTRQAHNRTFHLTPEKGTTAREFFDACSRYFNTSGVEFVDPLTHDPEAIRKSNSGFAASVFENVQVYQNYETTDPAFDTSNLSRFAGHLLCPPITAEMIMRFIDFGQQDRWGKRKKAPLDPKICFRTQAPKICDLLQRLLPARAGTVGIDIRGEGGCQLQIQRDQHGHCQMRPGLPTDGSPVFQIRAPELTTTVDDVARGSEVWPSTLASKLVGWISDDVDRALPVA